MKLLRKFTFRLFVLLPFLMASTLVIAQSDPTGKSPVTRTYAITKATIIPSPGAKIDSGTVIISDGVITAIGTNVTIPSHAEVIDGTDLWVYPGFIDAMSNTGANRPEPMERPDNLFTPDPPNDYAGVTPHISVIEQLDITESSISSMRKIGFTVSHTIPHGRMLPGKSSLILLSDAEHVDHLILKKDVSTVSQFVGAPGAYPGNTLGIMAKWRNIYRNAELSKRNTELYASNPTGLARPMNDRVSEAFYPVVEKSQPILFNASSLLEARRAIQLQKEMGFNLMIGNLEQSWEIIDELDNNNVSVFLSLDIPEKPEENDDEDKSEEVANLEARRLEFYNRHMEQFAALKAAGIKFGFSTHGVTSSKIKKNFIALQEFGFDSTDALAALTTHPAQLLGIDAITGTLETGKMGNALVSTGPYFSSDSDVKMVFVNGDKYDFEIKENSSTPVSDEVASVLIGTWNYSLTTPEGEQTGKWIFSTETGALTGVFTSNDPSGLADTDMENLNFANNSLSYEFAFDAGGQMLTVFVSGDIDGDTFVGTATIDAFNMSIPITATKGEPEQ